MMEEFKQQRLIHKRFAFQILLEVRARWISVVWRWSRFCLLGLLCLA